MKTTLLAVVVLLFASAVQADSYTVNETVVEEPQGPGMTMQQGLSFFINGPSVSGDDLVAELLGLTSLPNFSFGGYKTELGGTEFALDHVIWGTDFPVNYSFNGVFNLPGSVGPAPSDPPPATTPEPGSLLLFGSGIVGLGMFACRRNRRGRSLVESAR
jgi:hypothetical protein